MKEPSGPKPLSHFFAQYKKRLQAPETVVKDEFVVLVEEIMGLTISAKQVAYKTSDRTVVIKNGLLRSEILPHKDQLLSHLRSRLGERSAPVNII